MIVVGARGPAGPRAALHITHCTLPAAARAARPLPWGRSANSDRSGRMAPVPNRALADNIPGLRGYPLIGNIIDFQRRRTELFLRVAELGPIGYFKVGVWPVVMLNDAALAGEFLTKQGDAVERMERSRARLRPLVGNGLLVSEHELHQRQRKLMMPMFLHARIVAYARVMAQYAEEMAASWRDGEVIDLGEEMVRLTLRIVSKTLFSVDVHGEAGELSREITVALRHINETSSQILPAPVSWQTPGNRRFNQAVARMDRTLYKIIAAHRRGEPQQDIVSLLLQARGDDGAAIDEQQIRDELMTLFLAGHETTALALTWSWYVLTRHPGVYRSVRDEVRGVLGGRTPTSEDLPALPALGAAFKESLRLYPPVYLMPRQTVAPVTLGPYHLPTATTIIISPYVLHRDRRHFPDPGRFDAGRFAPDHEQRLPRFAYLPFGAGSTGCLGSHFAMMESQIILATLAQRVSFEPVSDAPIEPAPGIALRLGRPLRARVRRDPPGASDRPVSAG